MTGRDRAFLHGQLASVGIVLEPIAAPLSVAPAPAATAPVDRDEVRAILEAAGAPVADLEWLVASCLSIDDAKDYRPPPREAWCASCGGVRACDQRGCLVCQAARGDLDR
jgi:hypothetical protein